MEAIPEDVDPPVRGDGAAFVETDPSVLAGTAYDAPPAAETTTATVAEPDPETITGAGMVPPSPGPDEAPDDDI